MHSEGGGGGTEEKSHKAEAKSRKVGERTQEDVQTILAPPPGFGTLSQPLSGTGNKKPTQQRKSSELDREGQHQDTLWLTAVDFLWAVTQLYIAS